MPGRTRCKPLMTMTSPGFQALVGRRADPSITAAELDRAIFELVVGAEHEHEALALIRSDGAILDQNGLVLAAAEQLDARKQARHEQPSLLSSTARTRIVPVRRSSWLSTKSTWPDAETPLRPQGQRAPGFGLSREICRAPCARQRVVAKIRVLVAFEVHVDRIDRDDRGQQRSAVVAAGNEVAARDFRAAATAIDRRPHLGERQHQRGRIERGLRRSDARSLLIARAHARVELLPRDCAGILQLVHALASSVASSRCDFASSSPALARSKSAWYGRGSMTMSVRPS